MFPVSFVKLFRALFMGYLRLTALYPELSFSDLTSFWDKGHYRVLEFIDANTKNRRRVYISPFLANVSIFYLLKTQENHRFSYVFRGCKMGILTRTFLSCKPPLFFSVHLTITFKHVMSKNTWVIKELRPFANLALKRVQKETERKKEELNKCSNRQRMYGRNQNVK